MENNETIVEEKKEQKKNNNVSFIIVAIILIILIVFGVIFFATHNNQTPVNEIKVNNNNQYLSYRLSGNSLEDFDLYFMQLENEKKNKVYSPLSIKYALEMLAEGANGETKDQITNIIGEYKANKYPNSKNMSFANGLFIKDSYKDSVKESYVTNLKEKFNAEVVYDSFNKPDTLNNWVSNKTFKLVKNIVNDISDNNFIIVNALAIDMEWVNEIQNRKKDYKVEYEHEGFYDEEYDYKYQYYHEVDSLDGGGYQKLHFNNDTFEAKSVEIGADINKYDIISVLGEDNIRKTVQEDYNKWFNDPKSIKCDDESDLLDIDKYINELKKNYKRIDSSTDFMFYNDENLKVFAKDLKKYDGKTLQYIGILPKKENLDKYIENTKSSDINEIINNLKPIELNSFKDGVITKITGNIPMFKFDYELKLMDDLNQLGIKNVFDPFKADLSNLTTSNAYISDASHKANIEFSNEGIKAGAATSAGGKGAGDCGFNYIFEVPIEKIDLTFDKPYMFIIRDKDTGEVWFTGTVYEPTKYNEADNEAYLN